MSNMHDQISQPYGTNYLFGKCTITPCRLSWYLLAFWQIRLARIIRPAEPCPLSPIILLYSEKKKLGAMGPPSGVTLYLNATALTKTIKNRSHAQIGALLHQPGFIFLTIHFSSLQFVQVVQVKLSVGGFMNNEYTFWRLVSSGIEWGVAGYFCWGYTIAIFLFLWGYLSTLYSTM